MTSPLLARFTLAAVLLQTFGFQPAVSALPYQTFKMMKPWLNQHPFFPASQIFGGGDSTTLFRELTESRVVNFEVGFKDFEMAEDFERAPVVAEELVLQTDCPRQADQAPLVHVFFKYLNTANLGACKPSAEFSPVNKQNPQLIKLIKLVYADQSGPLLKDLSAARLVFQGQRYFRYDHADFRQKKRLDSAGLHYQFYTGKQFDYVLAPFGIVVAEKSAYYFQALKKEVEADQKLYDAINQQIQQQQSNQEKEKPFDFR